MVDELFQKMCIRAAESVEQLVIAKLRVFIERFARAEIKVIYTETEAAKFLCVSASTLQSWRKRGQIAYARYPQAKADDLSDMYSYSVADLLNFRERYIVQTVSKNVFEIAPVISLAGPEIKRAA